MNSRSPAPPRHRAARLKANNAEPQQRRYSSAWFPFGARGNSMTGGAGLWRTLFYQPHAKRRNLVSSLNAPTGEHKTMARNMTAWHATTFSPAHRLCLQYHALRIPALCLYRWTGLGRTGRTGIHGGHSLRCRQGLQEALLGCAWASARCMLPTNSWYGDISGGRAGVS